MWKLTVNAFRVVLVSALCLVLGQTSALAAAPSTGGKVGNDVSWPQCGKTLPTGQAFGIVGVNGGLANNTNPCFATQLAWANSSVGGTGQSKAALYVNTANPGLTGSWWPTANEYPAGSPVTNPYGNCAGGDDAACAYIYGYAKAYDDVNSRGVAPSSAAGYLWWLDVETTNSWETNTVANAADLEGMTSYFHSVGAQVGLYSTGYQWGVIAGSVSSTSNLNGLNNWIPGARSLKGAQANCSAAPFTAGSKVTVSQYVSGSLDYDYSCI
jgi:hypothetical protein